jgi:hypothetical protein
MGTAMKKCMEDRSIDIDRGAQGMLPKMTGLGWIEVPQECIITGLWGAASKTLLFFLSLLLALRKQTAIHIRR